MGSTLSVNRELSHGFNARKLRITQMLTQQELADLAGISQEDVSLFERNLPVRLEAKLKLLKTLWARKPGRE